MEMAGGGDETGALIGMGTWASELDALAARIGARFARSEARRRVVRYLQGLLGPAARKNAWHLAERVGDATPYAMQHLLGRARWEADAVRDDLQAYVWEHLADPEAILVIDETSVLKKGVHTVGVGPQYCGGTGHVENCQVGVFLLYASPRGATFLDRALYLPEDWAADPARRTEARVPATIAFATKPALARALIDRALGAGLPAHWVVGDEVYGRDGRLRYALDERRQAYAFIVDRTAAAHIGWEQVRVGALMAALPAEAWARLSAGEGTKGPRVAEWARVRTASTGEPGWARWFVARRGMDAAGEPEMTYFMAGAPEGTTLEEIARAAGTRWSIETGFQTAKGEVGLDEYEVRSWHGWHRHITLAMLAHAYLTVMRARGNDAEAAVLKGGATVETDVTKGSDLVPLSIPEVRRLLQVVLHPHDTALRFVLRWSLWRRRHQARAQRCHWRRSLAAHPP
jgi:SRSO17 transposase